MTENNANKLHHFNGFVILALRHAKKMIYLGECNRQFETLKLHKHLNHMCDV